MLDMQSDCSELLLVWVSRTLLFSSGQHSYTVKLLFQEMKAKEGSIVPSSMFMSAGVCMWVCVRSIFTICTGSPLPVNHEALGSQSRER